METEMENLRNKVIQALEMKLGKEYRIFPKEQRKNNEVVRHGICIRRGDDSVFPMVYVDDFVDPYAVGELTPGNIADILLECCNQDKIPLNIAEDLKDFEKKKELVRIRLVNYAANARELENSPHRRFLDLAIVYYLDMEMILPGQNGACAVTNALMEIWGVSEEELYCLGMEKLLAEDSCQITELLSYLKQDAQEEENELEERVITELQKDQSRPKMYIGTNRKRLYGAGCLLNTALLKEMAENTGCSLMIYPGSVHEILILPRENGSEDSLDTGDIKAINNCSVPPNEWLSNSIYLYDRVKHEVSVYSEGAPLIQGAA